jgi:ketosteroid isomerase-like protein
MMLLKFLTSSVILGASLAGATVASAQGTHSAPQDAASGQTTQSVDAERLLLASCERAVAEMAVFMDAGRAEDLAMLVTEDVEFVHPSSYPNISIRGRAEFRRAVEKRDPRLVSRHVMTNILAWRSGPEEITVTSYFVNFRGYRDVGSKEPIPIHDTLRSMGEYEDKFVPTAAGWKIKRRVARFQYGGL